MGRGRQAVGTIEQRGPHRFRASVVVGGIRQRKSFDTVDAANAWLDDLIRANRENKLPKHLKARGLTLAEAMRRYATGPYRPLRTWRAVAQRVEALIEREPALCARALYDIDEDDIAAYVERRAAQRRPNGQPLKPATVNHDVRLIQRTFELARLKWGCHGLGNPARGQALSVANDRVRRFEQGEEAALLAAAAEYERGPRAEVPISLIIRFGAASAMRLGELARMQWSDVNWEQSCVLVAETKNGRPRLVPLAPSTLALLRQRGDEQSSGPVWGSYEGIRTAWRRVRQDAARICPSAATMRFHDLRHEAVSRLFELKHVYLSDVEIAAISGHQTMSQLRRYAHLRAHLTADKLAKEEAARDELAAKRGLRRSALS